MEVCAYCARPGYKHRANSLPKQHFLCILHNIGRSPDSCMTSRLRLTIREAFSGYGNSTMKREDLECQQKLCRSIFGPKFVILGGEESVGGRGGVAEGEREEGREGEDGGGREGGTGNSASHDSIGQELYLVNVHDSFPQPFRGALFSHCHHTAQCPCFSHHPPHS